MLSLITTQCVQTDEEIAQTLGRDKYRVREALRKLRDADIVEELRGNSFTLAQGFWIAYERELKRSLIVAAERNQRRQHQKERRENEQKLAAGRANWRAKHDPKVVALASKRLRDLDREARLNQPTADEHLTEQPFAVREEESLMRDYDRMVERTMERLERGVG